MRDTWFVKEDGNHKDRKMVPCMTDLQALVESYIFLDEQDMARAVLYPVGCCCYRCGLLLLHSREGEECGEAQVDQRPVDGGFRFWVETKSVQRHVGKRE